MDGAGDRAGPRIQEDPIRLVWLSCKRTRTVTEHAGNVADLVTGVAPVGNSNPISHAYRMPPDRNVEA
jgi:hypothetical protein